MKDLIKLLSSHGTVQVVLAVGIMAIGAIAAANQNWTVAVPVITGAFAILRSDNGGAKTEATS